MALLKRFSPTRSRSGVKRSLALDLAAVGTLLFFVHATPARALDSNAEAARIVEQTGIAPGATVAEVGAGDGAVAVALARSVGPEGRVLATELEAEQLETLRAAAHDAGQANVDVIQAGVTDTGLPDACCDAIVLRHVYHHLTDPERVDASLFRALRPGGRLLIIDFPATWYLAPWTPEGVADTREGHGIAPAAVGEELRAAGFEVVRTTDGWADRWLAPDTYAVLARRPLATGEREAP